MLYASRLADRISALLADELRDADREVLCCAYMTLAHRVQQETEKNVAPRRCGAAVRSKNALVS